MIRYRGETWQTPTVTSYTDEAALEQVLHESPELLPGADVGPAVVVRQLYVPRTGPVDLAMVDVDGSLTLIECKLRANPEIRRSVLGQVLAYASGLWGLPYDDLDAAFRNRDGRSLTAALSAEADKAGAPFDVDTFRATVAANLERGAVNMVIAVDEITEELRRTVEFVNGHTTDDVSIVALELRYVAHGEVEVVTPHVYGVEAVRAKSEKGKPAKWDAEALDAAFSDFCSVEAAESLAAIIAHAAEDPAFAYFYWGRARYPSVTATFVYGDRNIAPWSIYTAPARTVFTVNFQWMFSEGEGVPPALLDRLIDRLSVLPGVHTMYADVAANNYAKRPSLPESAYKGPESANIIMAALGELFFGAADVAGEPRTAQ